MERITYKVQVKGRVQGVGFRPFICKLAKQLELKGKVLNNSEGAVVYLNSTTQELQAFLTRLERNLPPLARIKEIKYTESKPLHFLDFSIDTSTKEGKINVPLTPDTAICEACASEIVDPANRRYGYPFVSCVNCGPRYSITNTYPFERVNTSLQTFDMCIDCETEYTTVTDRRFHSQTNSCKTCGVQLELKTNRGEAVQVAQNDMVKQAAQILLTGKILAIKNNTGYVLCCDATKPEVVKLLRQRKRRPKKPFAILYPTIEQVKKEYIVPAEAQAALLSLESPIVLLENGANVTIDSKNIAPNLNQTGVLLPSTGLLKLLMKAVKKPLVCTSGNIHGSPILSDNEQAQSALQSVADYFLHHNLPIHFPQDDSVVKIVCNTLLTLRRARGFAPNYMTTKDQKEIGVLAMGAHLKSTFSFIPNAQLYVSQYLGNLDSYEVIERYRKTIEQQIKLFEQVPKTILVDSHPSYVSTILGSELATRFGASVFKVQHHKAHFASVLSEHDLFETDTKVLGVVWDGTGYGDDGTIWGGEFFIYEKDEMHRINHFAPFDWIANDKMAKEPRIALLSILDVGQRGVLKEEFTAQEWSIYSKLLVNNTLKTTSVGRLFDAVSFALGLVKTNSFEGEAAMILESAATGYKSGAPVDFLEGIEYDTIPTSLLVSMIVQGRLSGSAIPFLAYSFIYTLANVIMREAKKLEVADIACSGGVFQNTVLIEVLSNLCKKAAKKLKLNCKLSPNDENISFGQIAYFQNIKN